MALCLSRETKPAVVARINALKCDSPRQFGALSCHAMVLHLRLAFAVTFGELQLADQSTYLSRNVLKWLVYYVVPWPKGKIKVPDALTPAPENDFECERRRLLESLERFLDLADREPNRLASHPFFGPMPMSFWRRAHGMHMEHHFRQFGV